jgi:cysteine synthase B
MPHERAPLSVVTPLPDQSILDRIGNTPLIKVNLFTQEFPNVDIYAKAEWFNPGGSIKDRPALRMIEEAERTGELTREKVILDSTSGNTGIAYALIGAAKGYRVRLVMPGSVSEERKALARAYGAELVLSSALEGSDGAIVEARRLREAAPQRYYMPDQYNNPFNWRAHFDTTGPEILEQSHHEVTHFVAGIGTSGTLMGVGRFLKKHRPQTEVIAVEPDDALHGLEGLKFMETSIVPGIYDPTVHDWKIRVSSEEAYAVAQRLVREEGLLVGHSSGAALLGARAVARRIGAGVIVTVFPDGGDRYLSGGSRRRYS